MAATPPPTITPTPTPAPQRGDRATFAARFDAFITWITTAVSQFSAVATNVYNNAVDAFTNATAAASSASAAKAAADSAIVTANATAWVSGTYALNANAISQINFQTYRCKVAGSRTIDPLNDPTNWERVSSGYGIKGADIASAATVNLTTATGDFVHVTGTTTITAITIPVGASRTVIFDGVLTLTHSAGLLLPGAANIVTAAGACMIVRGDSAGAKVIGYFSNSAIAYVQTADQTITSAGALTIAHGLGRVPVKVTPYLKNITGEHGYVAGDIIETIFGFTFDGGAFRGVVATCDATNIYIRFSNTAGAFSVINKSTGVGGNICVNANWSFFVRAFA